MRCTNVSNRGFPSCGSKPSTRKHSSDQYLSSPVPGAQAQLPVWLSLCASAKYASLSRSDSSACFAAVTSVTAPTYSRLPEEVSDVRAKTWRYLTEPSGINNRCSKSTSDVVSAARSNVCFTSSLSSG